MIAWSHLALAISPYMAADNVTPGDMDAVTAQVEKKLQAGGFEIVGTYHPQGIANSGVIVVTDRDMLAAIAKVGGDAVVGAAIRIGVASTGKVSYMNPEYWYRAYLRKNFDSNESVVKALQTRLKNALGAGEPFGGDVDAADLPKYHYMFGMEYFDDDRDLAAHANFDEAVSAVRANLANQVGHTAKVYEIVLPDQKIAVFGVAFTDPASGDGMWVNRIGGTANIAALPYEIFVVGNKTEALYGRYRIALAWPSLTMVSFSKIMSTPSSIKATLEKVAK